MCLQRQWDKFEAVISCPPERPLTKYGSGDGSKLLCRLDASLDRADGSKCLIYSLGSNGKQVHRLCLRALNDLFTVQVLAAWKADCQSA